MSEENQIKTRGRQKGVSYKKPTGYIIVRENLRIEVETDCLTISEIVGKDKDNNAVWGNNKYFTSWDGVLSWLIRRFTTEHISKQEIWSFSDAKKEIISSIKEVKSILLGEIDNQMKTVKDEIKQNISKFNRNI